jgi:hypothetical protein
MSVDDAYTVALLHFDGIDSQLAFVDESGKAWTRNGDAHIHTAVRKFGVSSGAFDGTGDCLSIASADFSSGTGNFTVDVWGYITSAKTYNMIWDSKAHDGEDTASCGGTMLIGSDMKPQYFCANAFRVSSASAVSQNEWHHYAVVRNGNVHSLYVDGSSVGTPWDSAATYNNGLCKIGANYDLTSHNFTGYIDEFRFSNGVARWTANFTPNIRAYGDRRNYLHARRDRLDMRGVSTQNQLA